MKRKSRVTDKAGKWFNFCLSFSLHFERVTFVDLFFEITFSYDHIMTLISPFSKLTSRVNSYNVTFALSRFFSASFKKL